MRKGTDVKTVIFSATMVAALLCVGHPLLAQQQSSHGRQKVGADQANASSEMATDDDQSAGEDPGTALQQTMNNVYGYDDASQYDPLGQGDGQTLGYGMADPTDASYTGAEALTTGYESGDDTGSTDSTGNCCNSTCCGDSCCKPCLPFWAHRNEVFAELLLLRPRGADVAYAQVENGIGPAGVPFGPVGTVAPVYTIGYRAGFAYALNRCTSIVTTYTYFQSEANSALYANPPLSIQPLTTLPQLNNAGTNSLAAFGRENIRFQFADIDYKKLLNGGSNWAVNYTLGTRYANLHQAYREAQTFGPGVSNVATNINFDGLGTRIGVQGERKARNRGFLAYGKGFASLLVGSFRSGYLQSNNFLGPQGAALWHDNRAVPILEYELGVGWQNQTGRIRISAGYYFGAWFNTVSTNNFIYSVQNNSYNTNTSFRADTITFDGLTTRAEFRW